jgi:hypothetical protein
MAATDLYLIRATQQWVKYSGVVALTVTGAGTGDEVEVWSSEFRDIFSSSGSFTAPGPSFASTNTEGSTYSGPGTLTQLGIDLTSSTTPNFDITAGVASDEVAHVDLRQSQVKRTMWKFDFGVAATPRYAYAFVADNDIIANNPPETA